MTHILISWAYLWSFLKLRFTLKELWQFSLTDFTFSHKMMRTHKPIIVHTPKVDLDLLRVVEYVIMLVDTNILSSFMNGGASVNNQ